MGARKGEPKLLDQMRLVGGEDVIILAEHKQSHDARIILVACPTSPTPFIVWRQFNYDVEQLYWGGYYTNLNDALEDFNLRVRASARQ